MVSLCQKYKIDMDEVRTFQKVCDYVVDVCSFEIHASTSIACFGSRILIILYTLQFLWEDMPCAYLPFNPDSGESWYSEEELKVFRLSSKSHWDVPIEIDGRLLAAQPTPPGLTESKIEWKAQP
jgi:hypothetical protein